MADDNYDWQVFYTHEFGIRRHLRRRPEEIRIALQIEFDAHIDPHAYSQCLIDIANIRHRASAHFQEVELIVQIKTENPDDPWHRREFRALWVSNRSQINLSNALQRFTREQKRIRPNGVSNTDATSRDFTKALVRETGQKMQYLKDLWARAQTSVRAAGDSARAEHDNATGASGAADDGSRDNAAEPNSGEGAVGKVDQDLVQAQHESESSGSSPRAFGRKRRSREPSDDPTSDEDQPTKKIPRPEDHTEPAILQEPRSSNEEPLANIASAEHEVDPLEAFDTRWWAFLNGLDKQDSPIWQKLYSRARKLVEDRQPALFPDSTLSETTADFEIRVNKALEKCIGWDWEEYIDKIKADKHNLYLPADLKRAEQLRGATMQRAREGRSPMGPPSPREIPQRRSPIGSPSKEEVPQSRSSSVDEALTRKDTTKAIADDIIHERGQKKAGQWSYLTNVGKGGHGRADLWTGIRSDDHGMIVEVRARSHFKRTYRTIRIRRPWSRKRLTKHRSVSS